jgi:rare lipoprotein A
MDINVLCTQNWSRMFNVWIEDIQVIGLPAAIGPFALQGCLLPKVRTFARRASIIVSLLFALHCSSPRTSVSAVKPAKAPPGGQADGQPPEPPEAPQVYTERGLASWYGGDGDGFAGEITASGEVYDPSDLTCAHRTLPFGTRVEVENLTNGRRQILRVTDRGPFVRGRILDVSKQAAHDLGLMRHGVMRVQLRTVDALGRPAPVDPVVLQGNPYTIQVAALSHPGNIELLSSDLAAAFGPVTYQDAAGPGGIPIKRIRVGTYPRLEMAQTATEQLAMFCKDRGLEYFIVRQR